MVSAGATGQTASSMSLSKVKGNFTRFFDKSLTDLIRGIRNNKENEAKFIGTCMDEIKLELRQDNIATKTNAIAKLTYIQMIGYDISWAAFNIIEVMASIRFTDKRIGYLAASQSFTEETDVLMLTTNMMRKDLNSTNVYDSGVALGGLSCFVSHDLARDLANDVVTLLSSSRPYTRKRAVLLLYKVFLRYPDALRPTFPRLKERLDDPDPGVQSAAVNVICELARKNPKNYLSLAPVFFKLMTTSSNNWMLIKIIKLFGALVPLEPRLGKKLLDPLTNLINSTSAMSLLYECINTVIAVLISVSAHTSGDHTASIQLCVQKLGILIEDSDQNLKYLGLLAMGRILQTHPKAVQAHKDIVLACLDDKDESIRLRALDLLYGMVSKKNIMEIVKRLMVHVDNAEGSNYRDQLLQSIISICAHNNYQYIANFEWYVSVLVELTRVEGTRHGQLIADQMLDVAVRVESIRHFAVSQMALLIENAHVLLGGSASQRSNVSEVLLAAAWICGEYCEHVSNCESVFEAMLRTKTSLMPGHIQSSYVQNIGKLYSNLLAEAEKQDDWDTVASLDNLMLSKLPQFEMTDHLEGQERACTLLQLMKEIDTLHTNRHKVADYVTVLFDGELNPVAPKAQKKVPVPEGLDLDAWINEPPVETSESEESEPEQPTSQIRTEFSSFGGPPSFYQDSGASAAQPRKEYKVSEEELIRMREQRRLEVESNPYYMKPTAKEAAAPPSGATAKQRPHKLSKKSFSEESNKNEPARADSMQSPLEIPGVVGLDKYMADQQRTLSWKKAKKEEKRRKKKKRKNRDKGAVSSDTEEEDKAPVVHTVNRDLGEMPDGAKSTDDETQSPSKANQKDVYKALDINLDEPLREDEILPIPSHRVAYMNAEGLKETENGEHKERKKRKTKEEKKEKKHKSKSKKHTDETETEKSEKTKKKKKEKPKEIEEEPIVDPKSNLDLLLTNADEGVTNAVEREERSVFEDSVKLEKKKLKKMKSKEKSDDGKKRKKKVRQTSASEDALIQNNGTAAHLQVRDRSDYEVASGVCTPSNKETPTPPPTVPDLTPNTSANTLNPYSNQRLLAENERIQLMYEVEPCRMESTEATVSIRFRNKAECKLSRLDMNLMDSLNVKLVEHTPTQMDSGGVPLGFVDLAPTESQSCCLTFSLHQVNAPQRLRGSITYLIQASASGGEEATTTQENLDFHLKFPCVAFTVPAQISRESFAELLSSNELSCKQSAQFPFPSAATPELTMIALLERLCAQCHFSPVEQVGTTASLYCQTVHSQAICVLVKYQDGNVSLDGKCSDGTLLSYVLDEMKESAT